MGGQVLAEPRKGEEWFEFQNLVRETRRGEMKFQGLMALLYFLRASTKTPFFHTLDTHETKPIKH